MARLRRFGIVFVFVFLFYVVPSCFLSIIHFTLVFLGLVDLLALVEPFIGPFVCSVGLGGL